MREWNLSRAIWRARWLIILFIVLLLVQSFVTSPNTTGRLMVYKLMLGIIAAVVGHLVVKALYPYIDLRKLLWEDKADEKSDAVKFLGACVLRAFVMAAIIVGVLVGI